MGSNPVGDAKLNAACKERRAPSGLEPPRVHDMNPRSERRGLEELSARATIRRGAGRPRSPATGSGQVEHTIFWRTVLYCTKGPLMAGVASWRP
jgi:hypothetical protein